MLAQPAFGHRLRALRLERGLSQAALAAGGLSTGYLSRLESGARPPTARVVEHLAERLGVPVSAFDAAHEPQSLAQVLASVTSAEETGDPGEALADALRADDRVNPALSWQAMWLLARIRGGQGRHDEELQLLHELVALSDSLGSPELRARSRTELSRCVQALGDNTRARDYAHEAYSLSPDLSTADRAGALQALVSAEAEAGRLAEARAHADELCEVTEQAGGTLFIKALWASATVRIRQGDYLGAQEALERALLGLDSRGDLQLWMRLRLAAASLYLQITPPLTDRAAARLDEVGPVLDLVGTDLHQQQLLTLRAHLAFEEGRIEQARELVERIGEVGELLLSFRDRIRFQALRSQLLILDGQVEEGNTALRTLATQAQEALNVELAAEIWKILATTLYSKA
ncbi:helix-turn-helix domain-containing protein [Nonomuraea endophytica]|uniref:Transcriptional regulator with XRE-family HTH domain n=1 Tax=Nonomuraea endophytica TaxID=714136 RepID=A0A7W8A5P3_9ACTN|nr:helix-turn-helix domain-containing protein [Nonomuraea endophytica]MBB5078738.1 transcriptional regulator with XRE-family HTH domain [Nonomuraea endophytica]